MLKAQNPQNPLAAVFGQPTPPASSNGWTNEEPPFLNKAIINHALPMLVDGERAMQWVADRFNGVPTTPNCGEF